MRQDWIDWFIKQANTRLLHLEERDKPSRKYCYTNIGLNEVPFHMEFRSWLSKYVDRDEFDMECYHVHVWEVGDHFDEHTDNFKRRMFTYVCELQSSDCKGGLYIDDQLITEGVFPTHTPHRVDKIQSGKRISLTVFGYEPPSLL